MNFSLPAHRAPTDLLAMGHPGDRTAADLMADASLLAIAIRERLGPSRARGEILVICADRYHFAVSLIAVWSLGLIAALPPNGAPATVHALASGDDIRLIVHDTDGGEGLDLRQALARRGDTSGNWPFVPISIPAERTIATLYTSGSTGAHKRCPKTAAELCGEAAAHIQSFGIQPGERFVATVPGHHIYGLLWSVLVPLLSGGVFARQTPFFPEAVAARLSELKATFLVSVPAHLRGIAELDALPPLCRVTSSSAPLPAETAERFRDRFGLRVTEIFGSSETGGIAFREEPGAPLQPLDGVRVSADADGRLRLDSPFLSPNTPRPMPCDDRVEIHADGRFSLRGRLDGVVKIGGKRVSLQEIERHLLSLDGVRDAACLAEEVDSGRGSEIWAAVVAPGQTSFALKMALRAWLDPVTIPRRVLVVDALPREENGKIMRSRLRELFVPAKADFHFADTPEPLVPRSQTALDDGYALGFHIPEDFYFFRGHFDGLPILPGVVQLELIVRRQIARLWPDLDHGLSRVTQLKFKQLITPGTDLTLTLRRAPNARKVTFEITNDKGACSQGQFFF